jgi:5-methylcytosine-specific restriction endonuclease McrA
MLRRLRKLQCCFCGERIPSSDLEAVSITFRGAWSGPNEVAQDMFAHGRCTRDKFAPLLDPGVPFDTETFRS